MYSIQYGYYDDFGKLYTFNSKLILSEDYYKELKTLLKVQQTKYPKIRIGNKGDGGYVMIDDFKSKVAYSFGIDNNVTWDDDMYQRGYELFMYDPTVDFKCEDSRVHFFKLGIDGYDHDYYKSLKTILKENNHNENMILKMDVEGYEWKFLETVGEEIKLFDQIAFEIHELISGDAERNLSLLKKLNETHQLIHLHYNNSSVILQGDDFTITDVIEATYVKRDYELFDCLFSIPTELDYPNDIGRPDIHTKWNF